MAIAGVLTAPQAMAQAVAVGSNFEPELFPPQGWTLLDRDNDGHGWIRFSGSEIYISQFSGKANAVSFGKDHLTYSSLGAQDNWMITPPIHVTNSKFVLSFNYCAQDLDSSENLEVLISETDTNPESFTSFYTETVDNGYDDDPVNNSLQRSLSAYEGKTIYIAFRHTTSGSNSYALSLDNIYITNNMGPKKPTGFTAAANAENPMEANLAWTTPAQAADGSALEAVTINVYRDDVKIATVQGVPGQEQSYTDATASAGEHIYMLTASNDQGETQPTSAKKIFLGYDIAEPVKDPIAMFADGKITLTWGAPAKGANKGVIDIDALVYRITRVIDGTPTVVAENVAELRWTDESPVAGKSNIYAIQAVNESGASAIADYTAAWATPSDANDFSVAATAMKENTQTRLPADITSQYSIAQTMYFPEDLNFSKGDIKEIIYKIYRGTDTEIALPVEIYMHETEAADLSNGWDTGFTADNKVFSGTITLNQGPRDYDIVLDTPFNYQGGNLVVTMVKTDKPNANYSDRFYSKDMGGVVRSYTGSVYNPVDITSLPSFSTWSEKKVSEAPSTRFVIDVRGVASLSGKVTVQGTDRPVADAKISVAGYQIETVTDENGEYRIPYVPVDAASFTVTRAGFADYNQALALQEGVPAVVNVALTENANYTLAGAISCSDTKLPAEGAVVKLSGYDNIQTVANADGSWTLSPVYSNEDYTLTIEYPLYDEYEQAVNISADSNVGSIVLPRAPIAPFALEAVPAADGSSVLLSWEGPLDRDAVAAWSNMSKEVGNNSFGGDKYYSPEDFNVAHYFPASVLAERKLVGTVVNQVKVFLKATQGQFIAKVWEGDRTNHTELGAQAAPEGSVTADGGWVTITFDTPVEIRAGKDYMIGLQCLNASEYPVGTNSKYNSGYDNIKWDEAGLIYGNAYDAWRIDAHFAIPGTNLPVSANASAPACEYNVFRIDGNGEMTRVTAAPVRDTNCSDSGWASLLSGTYTYAVTAQYRDNASVPAFSGKLVRSNDYDVAVTEIISPVKQTEMQTSAQVKVKVANFGEKPVSDVPVAVTLNGEEVARSVISQTILKGESVEFVVGNIDLAEGVHDIVAFTDYEGDQVAQNNACHLLLSNMANISLFGYRWNAYGNAGFMSIESNNPESSVLLTESTPNDALITAGEFIGDTFYGYTATWYGAPKEFVKIKHGVWTLERAFENQDYYVMDLTYDYAGKKLYAITPDGEDMRIAVVDPESGDLTVNATLDRHIMTIAADSEGALYGIDGQGNFCTIDPATGATAVVGSTGIDGNVQYLQSMAFDHNTKRLFWVQQGSHSDGTLREINPATGVSKPLGEVLYLAAEPSEIVGLHTLYDPNNVGVATATANVLSVRPAGNGRLLVETPADAEIEIWDTAGRTVATATAKAGRSILDLGLSQGVYLLRAAAAGNTISTKLLVK